MSKSEQKETAQMGGRKVSRGPKGKAHMREIALIGVEARRKKKRAAMRAAKRPAYGRKV